MAKKEKQLGKSSGKFTLTQFAWNGFNLTVGIFFLGSLSTLSNPNYKGHEDNLGLGWHMIWIFTLIGIIAGICAFGFAKLSRHHKQDNNGGAYIFARSAFGRFVGFLTLFLNYIIMPLALSNQILMFIKANVDPTMSTFGGTPITGESWWQNTWWCDWTKHLGDWSYLTYDFIGLALSVVFILVAFFGTKIYKKVAKYSLGVKWVSGLFLILFGIVAACLPESGSNASDWVAVSNTSGNFTFSHFCSAFCTCFYYFTGFESFASAGSTVENPEKNIGKGIIIVMFASTLFYVICTVIFMMAINPNQGGFGQNIGTSFWQSIVKIGDGKYSWLRWLIFAGPIVMIICTIAMRGNTISQITLYGGSTLQPMSIEGYISDKFGKQNEDGFPIGAMKLNLIISAVTVSMFSIIPDLIVGIISATSGQEAAQAANFLNVNTIISAASAFYIAIYVIILLAVLKFAIERVFRISKAEWVLYPIVILCLGVIFVYHFVELFGNAFKVGHQTKDIIQMAIELSFIILCVLFVVIVYLGYYRKKYATRLKKSLVIQKKLNYEFRVLTGWSFLKGKLKYITDKFLKKRNYYLQNKNIKNPTTAKFFEKMNSRLVKRLSKIEHSFLLNSANVLDYNIKHGNNNGSENVNDQRESAILIHQLRNQINVKKKYIDTVDFDLTARSLTLK